MTENQGWASFGIFIQKIVFRFGPFWGIVLFSKRKDRFEIFKTENDWKIVFKNHLTIFKFKTENGKKYFFFSKRKSENSCSVLKRKTEKIVFPLKQKDGLTLSTFL